MIDAIWGLEHPADVTDLRSFSGLCNVFCGFVPNLAHVAIQLNESLCKSQLWTFDGLTNDERTALDTLKALVVEPLDMGLTLSQGDYTVHMDACHKQNGCILQQNNRTEHMDQSDIGLVC